MTVTQTNLITEVQRKLEDYVQEGAAAITVNTDQDATKRFKLPHEHLVSGSVVIAVDGVAKTITTDYTVNLDSGWLTMVLAPGAGKVITVSYQYNLYSSTDLVSAINAGLRYAWPFLPIRGQDVTLTGVANVQEYAMPADVAYIERLESSMDGGVTWTREYDWTTFEAWDTGSSTEKRYLRFLASAPIGKLRMRYVRAFVDLASGSGEMQKDAHVKDAAKGPVVFYACWMLLYEKINRKQRESAFLNDDAPNIPKVYESMRFADSLRTACDEMLNRFRSTPRLKVG